MYAQYFPFFCGGKNHKPTAHFGLEPTTVAIIEQCLYYRFTGLTNSVKWEPVVRYGCPNNRAVTQKNKTMDESDNEADKWGGV